MSRYRFIEQVANTEPVRVLCRVLHVSAAGFYQWLGRADRPTPTWEPAATAAFSRHAQCYSTLRLRAELRAEGHAVERYALRSWLRRRGLRALSTRPQRPRTTVAGPAAIVAENLLLGQPAPTAPNQVWVGDITYLSLVGGHWCYLATWLDTCSRRLVGWHLDQQALTLRQPAPGLIIHADCGSQYTNLACRARIEKAQALASYSRPGNPFENAQAEVG
jgi:putative transposase